MTREGKVGLCGRENLRVVIQLTVSRPLQPLCFYPRIFVLCMYIMSCILLCYVFCIVYSCILECQINNSNNNKRNPCFENNNALQRKQYL